jgi:hypothetical protein
MQERSRKNRGSNLAWRGGRKLSAGGARQIAAAVRRRLAASWRMPRNRGGAEFNARKELRAGKGFSERQEVHRKDAETAKNSNVFGLLASWR